MSTWEDRYDFIKDAARVHELAKQKIEDGTIAKCQTRHGGAGEHAFDFAPVVVGMAKQDHPTWTYTDGLCFEKMEFATTFEPSFDKMQSVTIDVKTTGFKSWWCEEYLLFASMGHFHMETFKKEGEHRIVFHNFTADDVVDI